MELIDIGANLGHSSFHNDLPAVLGRAREAGLVHIMVTGSDLESSVNALALSRDYGGFLSATAGFHPHKAGDFGPEQLAQIKDLCAAPEVVAVGETGLDYNRNYSPREAQLQAFETQLSLAADVRKPLFLHQRDAHQDFYTLLKQWRDRLSGGVVHCFTDSKEALTAYLDLDMYIGITGWICDERRGTELQAIVRHIPADRLLIETDAPYLLPRTLSGTHSGDRARRNEPCHLPEVLRKTAECRNEQPPQTAAATTANARDLFKLNLTSE